MIKALRIAGIAVAVAAVAAAVLVVIVFFSGGSDAETEKLLNAPGVVEAFLQSMGDKLAATTDETPALVKEAKAFALYLDPPKPPPPPPGSDDANKPPRPIDVVKPVFTAQFKILATSIYPSDPNRSFALVDEAGAELRWVRQGQPVGHFVLEEIKQGVVVLNDGQRTQEMAAMRPVVESLEAGAATAASASAAPRPAIPASMMPMGARDRITARNAAATARKAAVSAPPAPQVDEGGVELMNEFVEKMKAMQSGVATGTGEPPDAAETERLMNELMSGLKTSHVSDAEAEKLEELGQQLDTQSGSAKAPSPPARRGRRLPARPPAKVEAGPADANAVGQE